MDHRRVEMPAEKQVAPRESNGNLLMKSIEKIVDIFKHDSRDWGLSPSAALIIAAIPVLYVLVMVATVPFPDLFVWITAEDSFLEWLQFGLIFASCLIFAWSGLRLLQTQQKKIGALYLIIALGAFFVAGEEIAWGQRIFGWSTPETLEAVNSQQETTLHNISNAHPIFVYATMLVGLYGVLVPLLWIKRNKDLSSLLVHLLIPPLCLISSFMIPFGYRFSRLALGIDAFFPDYIFVITKFSEVSEVCLYFAVMVFALLNLRHVQMKRY